MIKNLTRWTAILLLSLLPAFSAELPGTAPWEFPDDIAAEQYTELYGYFERRISEAARDRERSWDGDDLRTVASSKRPLFREMIGAVDEFMVPNPSEILVGESDSYRTSLVSWPILRLGTKGPTGGFSGALVHEYGVLMVPKAPGRHPAVIAIADADRSAADIAGLTQNVPSETQYALQLAEAGFIVFAPFFVQRRAFSEPWTDDRNWLFRLGYQVGRHLIGSEVQQISSAVDYLVTRPAVDPFRIGVAGAGQGGLTALYAAAHDTRLRVALVSGYFDRRDRAFEEPEDRTLWRHLLQFGDAEVAAMIADRPLLIDGGGPHARSEFERAQQYYERSGAREAIRFFPDAQAASGNAGLTAAARDALVRTLAPTVPASPLPRQHFDAREVARIANAQFTQWQARYRNLALEAYATRDERWKPDTHSLESFARWKRRALEAYWDTIGRYPSPGGSMDAWSVQVYDGPAFTGYRLSVRVYDGVHAYGILLVPKGLRQGEQRPVVFTQHGLGGKPEDALGVEANLAADRVYSRFGYELAKRGYVVFAPMISTQTNAAREAITRRAHLLGLTPVGMELKKFGRVIDFLETLPFVDRDRLAFYGLSYGGYTALWIGPGEPRFRVVITSGHYNDWNLKTTDLTMGTSFLFREDVLDMFNFDLLHRFNHSEMLQLVAPRAAMVEIGDKDAVVILPHRFVDIELDRFESLYRQLGIPEKGRVARFKGPHKIDGGEAYPFLDRWLKHSPP